MCQFAFRVGLFQHLPKLYYSGYGKDATDHPAQNVLIVADLVGYELASIDKHARTQQGANANPTDVGIVMAFIGKEHFFCKQYGAPAKPERYLYRIDGAHEQAQKILIDRTA